MELSTLAREWAQRLVRFNTVSRESNLPLIECIADHLRSLQVPIRLTYDAAQGQPVRNARRRQARRRDPVGPH
jgi:hypothetical protein